MDMMHFKFSEPEHGWMIITVGNSEKELSHDISDVPCNSLESLAIALSKLNKGSKYEKIEFSLEPEYAVWEFEVLEQELILKISPDSSRDENITFRGNKDIILHRIYKGLRDLETYPFWKSTDLRDSKWSWEFPSKELNEFKVK